MNELEDPITYKHSRISKYSIFLLALFGFAVSLFCLLIIVFYAGSMTLASASAPKSVGTIYYSLAPLWVLGSLFGYIPTLLALARTSFKIASLPAIHILITVLGGYGALFIERSGSMRSEIVLWFITSVVSLLVLSVIHSAKLA